MIDIEIDLPLPPSVNAIWRSVGGKVIKSGEDLVDFASPYSDRAILPEDKIQKDSNDALQIVQDLIPGVSVTSIRSLRPSASRRASASAAGGGAVIAMMTSAPSGVEAMARRRSGSLRKSERIIFRCFALTCIGIPHAAIFFPQYWQRDFISSTSHERSRLQATPSCARR